jgi:branched-chain amino acid transport system substrate-binding protein
MTKLSRRLLLGGIVAAPLARPGIIHAQSTSRPVQLGLLSDMSGPYRDVGGPGNRVAAEMAVEDFGGEVLGRKIEVLQADEQNKPDLASAIAREWLDEKKVDALADGSASSTGLAIQQLCRDKKKLYMATGPATSDMTGKFCSPTGMQFCYDTYALAHGTGSALAKTGGKKWFFITADYAFGYALESDTIAAVEAAGGTVLGKVRAPLGTADFSSYLVQAQASGADVIGLANAGTDTQNCVKQAAEFGLTKTVKLATLLMQISDALSLGQKTTEGLVFTTSFYWNLTPATRDWSARWIKKMGTPDRVPGMLHASNYCATTHWLKAIKAAGTADPEAVIAKMKATKINDFYNKEVTIRADGKVEHEMYLWQVKPPSPQQAKNDILKLLNTTPGNEAWRPIAEGHCPFIKA